MSALERPPQSESSLAAAQREEERRHSSFTLQQCLEVGALMCTLPAMLLAAALYHVHCRIEERKRRQNQKRRAGAKCLGFVSPCSVCQCVLCQVSCAASALKKITEPRRQTQEAYRPLAAL